MVAAPLFGIEANSLIATQARGLVQRLQFADVKAGVAFGADDKSGPGLGDPVQPSEIQIPAIEDEVVSSADRQFVEEVYVVTIARTIRPAAGISVVIDSIMLNLTAASVLCQRAHWKLLGSA